LLNGRQDNKCYLEKAAIKLSSQKKLKEQTGLRVKLTKILFPHKFWLKKEEIFVGNKTKKCIECNVYMHLVCVYVCKKEAYFMSVMPSSTVYK